MLMQVEIQGGGLTFKIHLIYASTMSIVKELSETGLSYISTVHSIIGEVMFQLIQANYRGRLSFTIQLIYVSTKSIVRYYLNSLAIYFYVYSIRRWGFGNMMVFLNNTDDLAMHLLCLLWENFLKPAYHIILLSTLS